MRSSADCRSPMRALDSALNCPGRLSVRVATPSASSTRSGASAWLAVTDMERSSEREAPGNQPVRVGVALQRFAEVRVRDADQGAGALGDRLPLQVDEAVFR